MTVAWGISPTSGLVFHSAILGSMNGRRFDNFLLQTRLNLDPDEHVIFVATSLIREVATMSSSV